MIFTPNSASAVVSATLIGVKIQTSEPTGNDSYQVRLKVAMAAITGTYDGTVTLTDQVPPTSYRLVAEGKGRPGFLNGSSDITLRGDGAKTVVDVAGTVQTGGPIARLGQRLIGGVSKMMLDRFFGCLQSKLATHAGPATQ